MDAKTLALYLGCKFRYRYIDWEKDSWSPFTILNGRDIDKMQDLSIDKIQLLLRPLSSMTEEETSEFIKLVSVDHIGFSDFKGHQTWQYWEHEDVNNYESRRVCKTTSEIGALPLRCIQYLLSKGFDLFGLIEKGEALDATKQ